MAEGDSDGTGKVAAGLLFGAVTAVTIGAFVKAKSNSLDKRPLYVDNPDPINFFNVSPEFQRQVKSAYMDLPSDMRGYFQAQGVKFDVGTRGDRMTVHISEDSRGLEDARTHKSQVGAWYSPGKNRVVLNEWQISVHTEQLKHNTGDVNETVRHEFGHAFDWSSNPASGSYYVGNEASASPSFIAAYDADIARLGGPAAAISKGYGYYVTKDGKGESGRHEVFAEQWAGKHGGGLTRDFPYDFPNTRQWMGEFLEGHAVARAQGREALGSYYNAVQKSPELPPPPVAQERSSAQKQAKSAKLPPGADDFRNNYERRTVSLEDGSEMDAWRTRPGAFDLPQLKAMKKGMVANGIFADVQESVSQKGKYYLFVDSRDEGLVRDFVARNSSASAGGSGLNIRFRKQGYIAASPPESAPALSQSETPFVPPEKTSPVIPEEVSAPSLQEVTLSETVGKRMGVVGAGLGTLGVVRDLQQGSEYRQHLAQGGVEKGLAETGFVINSGNALLGTADLALNNGLTADALKTLAPGLNVEAAGTALEETMRWAGPIGVIAAGATEAGVDLARGDYRGAAKAAVGSVFGLVGGITGGAISGGAGAIPAAVAASTAGRLVVDDTADRLGAGFANNKEVTEKYNAFEKALASGDKEKTRLALVTYQETLTHLTATHVLSPEQGDKMFKHAFAQFDHRSLEERTQEAAQSVKSLVQGGEVAQQSQLQLHNMAAQKDPQMQTPPRAS